MFFFRARAEKGIAWHIDASSVVWTLKDFCCSNVSMLCCKTNGKCRSVYYWVMDALGRFAKQEARVAFGYGFVRLLRPWQTRTHCCGHLVAYANVSPFARARNICCGHKFCVRDTKNVSDFVQKHFVSATNVSQFAQPKKHHGQQSVRNNVSSFARAFRLLSCLATSRVHP